MATTDADGTTVLTFYELIGKIISEIDNELLNIQEAVTRKGTDKLASTTKLFETQKDMTAILFCDIETEINATHKSSTKNTSKETTELKTNTAPRSTVTTQPDMQLSNPPDSSAGTQAYKDWLKKTVKIIHNMSSVLENMRAMPTGQNNVLSQYKQAIEANEIETQIYLVMARLIATKHNPTSDDTDDDTTVQTLIGDGSTGPLADIKRAYYSALGNTCTMSKTLTNDVARIVAETDTLEHDTIRTMCEMEVSIANNTESIVTAVIKMHEDQQNPDLHKSTSDKVNMELERITASYERCRGILTSVNSATRSYDLSDTTLVSDTCATIQQYVQSMQFQIDCIGFDQEQLQAADAEDATHKQASQRIKQVYNEYVIQTEKHIEQFMVLKQALQTVLRSTCNYANYIILKNTADRLQELTLNITGLQRNVQTCMEEARQERVQIDDTINSKIDSVIADAQCRLDEYTQFEHNFRSAQAEAENALTHLLPEVEKAITLANIHIGNATAETDNTAKNRHIAESNIELEKAFMSLKKAMQTTNLIQPGSQQMTQLSDVQTRYLETKRALNPPKKAPVL